MSDLGDWSRFNEVYEKIVPPPRPVRTAVQAILLPDFMVEIEMWAVKP
ncbi:MAG: RidA family protein [Alphaproteobacteria bacterium]